ncbi:MAG: hypothetical protein PSX36_15840 [bacterium]|nr:hypothetical protein [bacterium]
MSKKKHSQSKKEPASFQVPGGYFENTANAIMERIAWEEENKTFVNLLKYKNAKGFDLPHDYFVKNEQILEMIPFPNLNAGAKEIGFETPPDYFYSSSSQITARVHIEEEAVLPGSLSKQNSFVVDPHYFQKNAEILRAKLSPPRTSRTIRLFPNRVLYPAAAALLVILGLWMYYFYFKPETMRDCGSMACIDKGELTKSRDLETLDEDQLYDLVNSKKLEDKLEVGGVKLKETRSDSNVKPNSVDELLDEI